MSDRTRAAYDRLRADMRLLSASAGASKRVWRRAVNAVMDAALNFGLAAHELTCTPCWAGKTDQCPEYRRLQELPLGLNPHEPARADQRKERQVTNRAIRRHKKKPDVKRRSAKAKPPVTVRGAFPKAKGRAKAKA